jgi:hypothetical protein
MQTKLNDADKTLHDLTVTASKIDAEFPPHFFKQISDLSGNLGKVEERVPRDLAQQLSYIRQIDTKIEERVPRDLGTQLGALKATLDSLAYSRQPAQANGANGD